MTTTAKKIAAARKEFATARTKHRNLRLGRYEGRNNGGDSTRNLERAGTLARELGRELEGLLWAEHREAERVSENRDAGQGRPELRRKLNAYRRRIAALADAPADRAKGTPASAKLTREFNAFFGPMR